MAWEKYQCVFYYTSQLPLTKGHKKEVEEMIRKEKSGYVVYSEKGKKLSKTYKTKKEAAKRLGEIEYFKNKGK